VRSLKDEEGIRVKLKPKKPPAEPVAREFAALTHAVREQLALAEDILTSDAALLDGLARAGQLAGAGGFASVTQHLATTSDELQKHNDQLIQVIEATLKALEQITASMHEFEERFEEVEERIAATHETTSGIRELALRSKILSLNARIEAAHLGNQGAGFNVVAEEMGSLSRQTQDLSSGIVDNLSGMREAMGVASEKMRQSQTAFGEADSAMRTLEGSSETLATITAAMVEATHEVEQIAYNQVELQAFLEHIQRNAAWVREAGTTLKRHLGVSQAMLAKHWLGTLPGKAQHVPKTLDAFEAAVTNAIDEDAPHLADQALEEALSSGLRAEDLMHRVAAAAMHMGTHQTGAEIPTETHFKNAAILQSLVDRLEKRIKPPQESNGNDARTVVLGNAFEDYHDLGRRLVALAMRAAGLHVVDLGLSVDAERFADQAREHRAGVVGVSTLLLHTAKWIPSIRAALDEVAIIAGGAPFLVDPQLKERFPIDGVGRTPAEAVRLAQHLLTHGRERGHTA
jgi:methylmalonyl-CoA mutase cobalamin-binding domain/chain